jgi:ABC-2 type transport system ATP-binding protein
MINVNGLSKSYSVKMKQPGLLGSVKSLFRSQSELKHALKEASFEVESGEIVGLIGANGAGKTTLVKMLSGIMQPTSGVAHVLGHLPWERKSVFKKQISVIMGQKAQLWWDLPAHDCFLLLKQIYQIPDRDFNLQFHKLVELLNVAPQLNIQIRRLSLGERMKMELIAALLHNPKVIFLDEPTIGLDLSAQNTVRGFLQDYQKEHAPSMLLTSHYMEDIEKLCKRVIILRHGEIVYNGSLQSIVNKHSTHKKLKVRVKLSSTDGHAKDQRWLEEKMTALAARTNVEHSVSENGLVVMRVLKQNLSALASEVFAQFEVVDLAIEEEDLSSIVEKILDEKIPTNLTVQERVVKP